MSTIKTTSETLGKYVAMVTVYLKDVNDNNPKSVQEMYSFYMPALTMDRAFIGEV